MEAIAKHDFNATADDELSFRKNQILKVNITKSSSVCLCSSASVLFSQNISFAVSFIGINVIYFLGNDQIRV